MKMKSEYEDEDIPPPVVAVCSSYRGQMVATGHNTMLHAAIVTLVPTPPSHQEKLPTFSSVTAATGDTASTSTSRARGTG